MDFDQALGHAIGAIQELSSAGIEEGRRQERERCASIAEGEIFGCNGTPEGYEIARLIRGEE
jgi:hypothetical protein